MRGCPEAQREQSPVKGSASTAPTAVPSRDIRRVSSSGGSTLKRYPRSAGNSFPKICPISPPRSRSVDKEKPHSQAHRTTPAAGSKGRSRSIRFMGCFPSVNVF